MKTVKGNKIIEISRSEFEDTLKKFDKVHIDLGTGDGRFVFENGKLHPKTLFIGIDPSQKQLEIYSKKSVKSKMDNVLFIVGSIEKLPDEIGAWENKVSTQEIADEVSVLLPWGSLLQAVAAPNTQLLKNITSLVKRGGRLIMLLGYTAETDPGETWRLRLPILSDQHLESIVIPALQKSGFELSGKRLIENNIELKGFPSSWSKKLAFGKPRSLYFMEFRKI
jgi:16S rRNA (adenine(1408)-N(1))-methyltransferase